MLSAEELVREIEQYQCLRALRLEGNTVGVDAARAIAKALEGKDLLQVLLSLYLVQCPMQIGATQIHLIWNQEGCDLQ